MYEEFVLCCFVFERTRFMSNAACSVSVNKLFSYLELLYARVYGYLKGVKKVRSALYHMV